MIFRFEISADHPEVENWLLEPSEPSGLSVLSAVQTIWRAYGTKNGASFNVVLKS